MSRPVERLHVLLQPPDEERVVLPLDRLLQEVLLREEARPEEVEEEAEVLLVAAVRGGGEEQQVVGLPRQHLADLVPLRLVDLGPLLALVGVGAHLVRLVHDDEVPLGAVSVALTSSCLRKSMDVIARGSLLPDVLAPVGADHVAVDEAEGGGELLLHLPLPLVLEVAGRDDEDALDEPPVLHLLEDEPGHDRLPRAGVVGDEEPHARHLEGVVVDGLDLVRERVHLAHADGQHGVELVGEPDAVGLDQEEELLGVAAERAPGSAGRPRPGRAGPR